MRPLLSVLVLSSDPLTVLALAEALVESVADGGSLTFLHPLSLERAVEFWTESFLSAERGEVVVLGAIDRGQVVGTVTLRVDWPETQSHRAEIGKVITLVSHRRRGIAQALMKEAERQAHRRQKRLLTLEAAAGSGASVLYESLGYQLAGVLPGGELTSFGDLVDTAIYYKRLQDDGSHGQN